jgi:hypothetical protein
MRITRGPALAISVLALAGCAGAGSTVTVTAPGIVASPAAAVPANPVPVLRLTGATPSAGEKYGNPGLENDQVAYGTFPGGEQVFVFTYDTAEHRSYWVAHPSGDPQAGESLILGPHLSLITVISASPANPGGPSAQLIAVRVGGTVILDGKGTPGA